MLLCILVFDASLARIAMEMVVLPTDFAHPALVAMPLVFGCVIVVKKADFAVVQSECDFTLLAIFRRVLYCRAVITGDLLHFFRIEVVRDPRYIIIPILAYFFFDGLKVDARYCFHEGFL